MRLLLTLATLIALTRPLQANDRDDHDHLPVGTLLVLEGQDVVTRKDCALYITDVGFTGPEQTQDQFYAVVETSYTHGSDRPAAITISFNSKNNSILSGLGQNQKDQIAVMTEPGSQDLMKAKSFNLRWFHNNHFDNFRCGQLKVHEH